MKANRKTAGKTATNNGGAQGAATSRKAETWHRTTRKGVQMLVSPEGRNYYGTAQEVRDAALSPFRRKSLAQDLYWARDTAEVFEMTPAERRAYYAEKRMDAIQYGAFDYRNTPSPIAMTERDRILIEAGARFVGFDSFDKYAADLVRKEIESFLDYAQTETGKREIPLTRYERAALARMEEAERSARRTA